MRLVGRPAPDDGLNVAHVPEGPELVGTVTEIPQRSGRAEPIRRHILDAAEQLFAKWGYTGVSVRDVTDLAERRLADVTYYFGSKQNLYFEVLRRRAAPLGEARLAELGKYDDQKLEGQAYIEAWVNAYLDPPLRLLETQDPGWSHYLRLIGHVAYSRLWPDHWGSFYNEPAEKFMASLHTKFPAASDANIQQAFLMLTASTMYTLARTGRVETFVKPAFSSDDIGLLAQLTRDFIVAGVAKLVMG
nr:TetR family transcriptional regulator [Sphingobium subterraneum]